MKPTQKAALIMLSFLALAVIASKAVTGVGFSSVFRFDYFEKSSSKKLEQIIENRIKGQPGEYAVVAMNFDQKEPVKIFINQNKTFPAASLYKLFLLAEAFEAIEKGEIKEDTILTSSKKRLEKILGFEDFGYEDAPEQINYTLEQALKRVAEISDNYAAIMVAEKLGWDTIDSQAKNLGTISTSIKDPITTTPSDIALFLEKLYKKEIVSLEASDKIIALLSGSRINNRIPQLLPQELKIAHKTAELPKIRHDVGIIYLPENPYILVLMSKDLKYEDDGVQLLANISKDVYEYFKVNSKSQITNTK